MDAILNKYKFVSHPIILPDGRKIKFIVLANTFHELRDKVIYHLVSQVWDKDLKEFLDKSSNIWSASSWLPSQLNERDPFINNGPYGEIIEIMDDGTERQISL